MTRSRISVCIGYGILVLCIAAFVLIPGCSSPPPASSPPLATPAVSATPAGPEPATVLPVMTTGTCRQGLTWCDGHCSDLSVDIGDCGACGNPCPDGTSCVSGQCCLRGYVVCNGICSDLTAEVKNCGSCGNACPAGSICHESKCLNMSITCPAGQTECLDERCHDLTSENMNCGRCGLVCPAYSGCINSVCVAMEGEEDFPDIVINMPV